MGASTRVGRVLRAVDSNSDEMVRFLRDLVRTPSVTGDEAQAQDLVRDKLRSLGGAVDYWKPRRSDFKGFKDFIAEEKNVGGRPNVVGVFHGSGRGRRLGFNGHVDVVPEGDPASWLHRPYSGTVEGRRMYGRGACDMKAGLASVIFAVQALLESGARPSGDLVVSSVIGEESGGMGTLASILRGHAADGVVIAEPTSLRLVIAQAGCLMFRLKVKGKQAHGASRYMGVSAIEKFQPVLASLLALEDRRRTLRSHPLFRGVPNPVTLSIGKVRAGNWDSTVPEELVAEGRYGVWPGETLDSAKSQFESAVNKTAQVDEWLSRVPPEVSWFGPQWESAEISAHNWLAKLVSSACRRAIGRRPRLAGITGGTDMRLYTNLAHVPALVFGPGDDSTAHFSNESVDLDEVTKACKVYAIASLDTDGD
ncbi:MAG TPA: ArgE/DapE family deacylase [Nitrososphaerales archaeon]|nr:ArgE/DapE family deacylase [Nitrososphaerales archaeon]